MSEIRKRNLVIMDFKYLFIPLVLSDLVMRNSLLSQVLAHKRCHYRFQMSVHTPRSLRETPYCPKSEHRNLVIIDFKCLSIPLVLSGLVTRNLLLSQELAEKPSVKGPFSIKHL